MYYKLVLDWDLINIKSEELTDIEKKYKELTSKMEKSNPLLITPLSFSSIVCVDIRNENDISGIKQYCLNNELDLLNRFNVDSKMIEQALENYI